MSPVWHRLDAKRTVGPGVALLVLGAIAWFSYAPGLSGAFLFDDWANLPTLGAQGPVDNWHTLVTYLLSGIAGPSGRPVALLSFLIDANDWPAAPEPFKYTNVLIHLLNGCLLAWLILKLTQILGLGSRRAAWTAVLATGIWLLHPLMVSTTLFVVQRMTMLAATFVLTGLLSYVYGRQRLVDDYMMVGYLWMTTGAVLCGLLAVLSKENGALLPVFIILVERLVLQHPESLLRSHSPPAGMRIWQAVFIYLPLALFVAYLASRLPGILHSYANIRDFTLGERLLTETRILVQYLALLLAPRAYSGGLYNDAIQVSTGLLSPWTTLPAAVLIVSLIALAWRLRQRHPLLALAVLFYFSGHVLESTFIPLELYFEHRNYLPAAFLFLPLARWLTTAHNPHPMIRYGVALVLLVVLTGLTAARATLWGQPFEQAAVWATKSPDSPRAQTTLALHLMHRGNYIQATQILQKTAATHPNDIMVQLNLVSARCGLPGDTPIAVEGARQALRRSKIVSRVAYNAISKFIRHFAARACPGLGVPQLESLIQAALENPHVKASPGWLQNMLTLRGELRIAQHDAADAATMFRQALEADPRPDSALYMAALLGTAGYPDRGLALLDHYQRLRQSHIEGIGIQRLRALWLRRNNYYARELARIRRLLTQDAREQHPTSNRRSTPPTRRTVN